MISTIAFPVISAISTVFSTNVAEAVENGEVKGVSTIDSSEIQVDEEYSEDLTERLKDFNFYIGGII